MQKRPFTDRRTPAVITLCPVGTVDRWLFGLWTGSGIVSALVLKQTLHYEYNGLRVGSSPSGSVQALAREGTEPRLLLSRFGRRAKVLATGLAGESNTGAIR